MKRFYFRSVSDYVAGVLNIFVCAALIVLTVFAIRQGEIGIIVLCAVLIPVLILALVCFFTMGRLVITSQDVRIYAPACMPKRFARDDVKAIFFRFKRHKRRRWYEATVEVQLKNGENFAFNFYHTAPRGVRIGKISPKRKAKLEALASDCRIITCETTE